MSFDDNTTKIIIEVIGFLALLIGGSFIAIKISKKRSNNVKQNNITINGSGKVVGGDDNSINK